jgi:hypothetical protein
VERIDEYTKIPQEREEESKKKAFIIYIKKNTKKVNKCGMCLSAPIFIQFGAIYLPITLK